jgi:hypothetical protein
MFDETGGWGETDSAPWQWLAGGRRLLSGLKSVVIPSSIEVLCKSSVRECDSVESVMFEAGSKLQRIEQLSSEPEVHAPATSDENA